LTCSGRCFTSKELEKQRKAKGKEVVNVTEKINKLVMEEETNEILKLMKYNEYIVVEQLKKTIARISLLSLILSSEPYSKALQKVLNEAYVP
jgi:tRNA uridine 5-carbamoylmethylation protein Kti12